jgi:hypothetical protein
MEDPQNFFKMKVDKISSRGGTMRYRLIWMALMGWTLVMGIGMSAWPMPTTLVVDDDGKAALGNCDDPEASAFSSSIQSAINAAAPGDTVFVCPGIYTEQVTIHNKPGVTLEGSGIDLTVVKPTTLSLTAPSLFSGQPLAYIILVDGASGVTIKNLTVDGFGAAGGSCDPGFIGIFYRASSGTITGVKVTSIKEPLGCQNRLGIFVQSGYGPHLKSDVTITDSTVEDYGKNGITCNEAGTRCIVVGNTVTGIGPTAVIGQNGIQLGFGAHGRVFGNVVSGNVYTPEPVTACGILIFRAGGTVSGNTLDNNETTICNSAGVEMPEHPPDPVKP